MTLYIPSYNIAKDTQLNTQDKGKKEMMKIKERQEMLLLPYITGLDRAKYLDTILNSTRVKHKDLVLYNMSRKYKRILSKRCCIIQNYLCLKVSTV